MSAELLGIPTDFPWKDKLLKLCARDLHVEAQFCLWVASEAALELARLRPRVPADFYAEQMKAYSGKVCGRQFTWGTGDVHEAYWSPAGQRHMVFLKLLRGQAKGGAAVNPEDVDEMAKDPEVWQRLLELTWQQDDPGFFAAYREEKEKANPSPPGCPPPTA